MPRRQGYADWLVSLCWPTLPLASWALTSSGNHTWWLAINLACWPLFLLLSVVLHELGHALAGALVGLRPYRIRLGLGSRVWLGRIRTYELEVGRPPFGGLTFMSAKSAVAIRARVWVSIAGGPAVTFALLQLATSQFKDFSIRALDSGPAAWEVFGAVNAFILLVGLFPGRIHGRSTDGRLLLLEVPWFPRERFDAILIVEELERATKALQKRDIESALAELAAAESRVPGTKEVLFMRAFAELVGGRLAEARAAFLPFLESPRADVVALAKNNLAWVAFMMRDPARLEEALLQSEEALASLSGNAAVQGTRGSVLFWAGKHEEARSLLLSSAEMQRDVPHNRAFNACVLAMVCGALGDTAEAVRWLGEAESSDPHCPLLSEARGAIGAPS